MFRTIVWLRSLLCVFLLPSAGCGLVHEVSWLPHHQSLFLRDDPRAGEVEIGRGWLYPWDEVTDEVIIVGEPVTGCLQPSAKEIQSDLDDAGICARIMPANSVLHAATDIMALKYAGASSAPVIIIGCGPGIEDAVRMCRSLKRVRVPVDRLILVGNTCCERVPDNIRSCVNIYHSRGGMRLTHGKPVFREGDCTEVLNYDLAEHFDTPDWVGLSDSSRSLVVYHVRELAVETPPRDCPAHRCPRACAAGRAQFATGSAGNRPGVADKTRTEIESGDYKPPGGGGNHERGFPEASRRRTIP